MSSNRPLAQQDALEPASTPDVQGGKRRSPKRVLGGLGVIAAVVALGWGGHWYLVGRYIETTDDAYLQADSMTVAPKVGGYIAEVLVADNQQVEAGQPLVTLEAMKMEHVHLAAVAGRVAALSVGAGEQVTARRVLAEIEAAAS